MRCELRTLHLTEPFRIAHGTSTERTVLRLSHDGVSAEAPFVPYYAESPEAAMAALSGLSDPFDALPADAPRVARLAHDVLQHLLLARRAQGVFACVADPGVVLGKNFHLWIDERF